MFNIYLKSLLASTISTYSCDGSLEDALDSAVSSIMATPSAWGAEIHNRAGFVLRVTFAYARKPVADRCHMKLSKNREGRRDDLRAAHRVSRRPGRAQQLTLAL